MNMKANLKDTMRAGIGGLAATKAADSIFTQTSKPIAESKPQATIDIEEPKARAVIKQEFAKDMERVAVPMPFSIREEIERLAKAINKNGQKKKNRITSNSVMRALLQLLPSLEIDISKIDSEESLKKAILTAQNKRAGANHG